jgi:hypothetical protein
MCSADSQMRWDRLVAMLDVLAERYEPGNDTPNERDVTME